MNSKIFKIRSIFNKSLNLCHFYQTESKQLHIPVMLNEVLKHLVYETADFKVSNCLFKIKA